MRRKTNKTVKTIEQPVVRRKFTVLPSLPVPTNKLSPAEPEFHDSELSDPERIGKPFFTQKRVVATLLTGTAFALLTIFIGG